LTENQLRFTLKFANRNLAKKLQESTLSPPPFRAEQIGSLLRPPLLLDLRRQVEAGRLPVEKLHEAEEAAIRDAVALQERVGFKTVTDGEFRRRSYHSYFFGELGDIIPDHVEETPGDGPGKRGHQPMAIINSRVRWTHPIHVDDYRNLVKLSTALPKITIPGPCALHFRGGDKAVLKTAYKDVDQFWDDVVTAFRTELQALADAGCTYVQMDETAFAKFGDPEVQATLAARGDDWRALINHYIAITNRVLIGLPPTLRIGMHLCRGNRGGQHHAEGGYDVVAEKLFNQLAIDFFYLEYDSPRAGGFSPLRHVPKNKSVVLGLVSTKSGSLETKDVLKKRIDEAAALVDIGRLAISPQCGFASVDTGNPLTMAEQEAKMRLVVDVAKDVWQDA
jgi:5-methyltetrahydropteroyltriglutamate--homocysteine methyltransferase